MKQKSLYLFVLFCILIAMPTQVHAVPKVMSYQGYLTNTQGTPVNGTIQLTFRIYNLESGGVSAEALWAEIQSVEVNNGVYCVTLGEITPINLAFDENYYLGIEVDSDGEMTPRQLLTSTGYAIKAGSAESIQWANITEMPAGFADGADNDSGGTVTSISTGPGLTGGTITSSGTISVDVQGISNDMLGNNSVSTEKIANGQVTNSDIADNAVNSAKIQDGSITGADIYNGTITGADIQNETITHNDINTSYVQKRVSGTCNSGSSIRSINADGSVTCEAHSKGNLEYNIRFNGGTTSTTTTSLKGFYITNPGLYMVIMDLGGIKHSTSGGWISFQLYNATNSQVIDPGDRPWWDYKIVNANVWIPVSRTFIWHKTDTGQKYVQIKWRVNTGTGYLMNSRDDGGWANSIRIIKLP